MKKHEAIKLLAACKSLAERLAVHGTDIELTSADQIALVGFTKVAADDEAWLDTSNVDKKAGLNQDDISALSFMAAKGLIEGL